MDREERRKERARLRALKENNGVNTANSPIETPNASEGVNMPLTDSNSLYETDNALRDIEVIPAGVDAEKQALENTIMNITSDYIRALDPDERKKPAPWFPDLIQTIHAQITIPDYNNIQGLDDLFNIYVRVCNKAKINPTLEMFCTLTGYAPQTFYKWAGGVRRVTHKHGEIVKKWIDICNAGATYRLQSEGGSSVNLIFWTKAAIGLREDVQVADDTRTHDIRGVGALPTLEIEQKN